jgi:hypothetical protein
MTSHEKHISSRSGFTQFTLTMGEVAPVSKRARAFVEVVTQLGLEVVSTTTPSMRSPHWVLCWRRGVATNADN